MSQRLRLLLTAALVFFIVEAQAADLSEMKQELSDSVITAKITAKFTKDRSLNPLKISVTTDHGAVTLKGHVKNSEAFVEALRLTAATKGVISVDTDDLDIKRVNTVFTDAYITTKVEAAVLKAKVLDDESIPLVGINATTTNGVVTLTGNVIQYKSVNAILNRVNAVRGVKKIVSSLHVQKSFS